MILTVEKSFDPTWMESGPPIESGKLSRQMRGRRRNRKSQATSVGNGARQNEVFLLIDPPLRRFFSKATNQGGKAEN